MRMRQGVRTGLGHGGITCVLQTQFSSFLLICRCFRQISKDHMNNLFDASKLLTAVIKKPFRSLIA